MSTPDVSVVMPAFNAAPYIAASMRSALAQTAANLELIVVDDASTDDTAAIVDALAAVDTRVRRVTLPANMGAPAGPRNIGVREARAPWVAFLDADDIWDPRKVAMQLRVMRDTGVQFCSTRMVNFRNDAPPVFPQMLTGHHEPISFVDQLIKFRTPLSSVMAAREVLLRFPFDERPEYKAREDLDCWLRCHEYLGDSVKLKDVLVGYRLVPGQISSHKWLMIKRHFNVLRQYRLKSGHTLGWAALPFTVSHFALAPFYRVFRKGL